MKLIYQNFDKLELSFKGCLSKEVLDILAEAKKRAQDEKLEEVLTEIGTKRMKVMVAPNGMKGGYAYMFSTGGIGEIWSIKNDRRVNQWNIRISVRSLNLAISGYYRVKERTIGVLKDLGAQLMPRISHSTGKTISDYEESIARVDYCFDFLSDSFLLNPDNLVMHSHMKMGIHHEIEKNNEVTAEMRQGKRCITVTAGKMPNKQIQIYDKTKEVSEKRKKHWFKIWNIDQLEENQRVWRVEVRFGKDYLSKNLKLKTFSELESHLPEILQNTLQQTRYIKPSLLEKNITRVPKEKFWNDCIKASENCVKFTPKTLSEKTIKELIVMQKLESHESLMLGNVISYASLLDLDFEQIPECIENLSKKIRHTLKTNIEIYNRRFNKAQERHALL